MTQERNSGLKASYYLVNITNPNQGTLPYQAECGDIIEALGMDFNEGNEFKALWRQCAARTLGKHKAGNEDATYDIEKRVFYATRSLAHHTGKKVPTPSPAGPATPPSYNAMPAPWGTPPTAPAPAVPGPAALTPDQLEAVRKYAQTLMEEIDNQYEACQRMKADKRERLVNIVARITDLVGCYVQPSPTPRLL